MSTVAALRAIPEPAPDLGPARPRLEAMPISRQLRNRGYHECYPPDPMGLGPYAPARKLGMRGARVLIPKRGGHTKDLGFDVLLHFHGMDPLRKTLVQVAGGVVLAGVDRGAGSGRYTRDYRHRKWVFPRLRRAIERALQRHTGDERAHIRHLALSSWSAGFGAVVEILKQGHDGIDAVVLLDSLHAGFDRTIPARRGRPRALSDRYITPVIEFAEQARDGEKILILTHSNVDPVDYPSTRRTADLLLQRLGLVREPKLRDAGLLTQTGAVDIHGLHVWSYRGTDEHSHCAHLSLVAEAVRDVLEVAWDTPLMERESATD
jgi:hypothetical protein